MSKVRVICPFLTKLCKDCAYYRARHYYLGYCRRYRGFIGNEEKVVKPPPANPNSKFEIPLIVRGRAIDPFAMNQE